MEGWWRLGGSNGGGYEMGIVQSYMGDFRFVYFVSNLLRNVTFAATTCIFALGGAIIGGIAGAMKGQTTETGFCRGAGIGIISGAIVGLELLDSFMNGHFFSKVGLIGSIVNGKAFREWVSPAVLKAYLWQISTMEAGQGSEILDIYDTGDQTRGMSPELIAKLPVTGFRCESSKTTTIPPSDICCTICLQEFEEGKTVRKMPGCGHLFHLGCIDEWLTHHASCPICRHRSSLVEL